MKAQNGRAVGNRPRLLWIGDAVAHTGFAAVTHGVLDHLSKTWDVNVLGINYFGDPHEYSYPVWPASRSQEDMYGFSRVPDLTNRLTPDVIVILNDPWILGEYVSLIKEYNSKVDEYNAKNSNQLTKPKIILYTPVDGLHIKQEFAESLNGADCVIAYTKFGLIELLKGGLTTKTSVIPHGFNSSEFFPVERGLARDELKIPRDWFVIGCVNRNQPRKRIDLLFNYFSKWAENKPENVKLHYHGAIKDVGWDIIEMAAYYEIDNRLILTHRKITSMTGVTKETLRNVYSSFDVQVSTTMGEGWGLTTMEGMACGTPQIVPDWSALAEWPEDAVIKVPCTSEAVHPGGINTIGGIVDSQGFIEALDLLYKKPDLRKDLKAKSMGLLKNNKFKWKSVANQFDLLLKEVIRNDT